LSSFYDFYLFATNLSQFKFKTAPGFLISIHLSVCREIIEREIMTNFCIAAHAVTKMLT